MLAINRKKRRRKKHWGEGYIFLYIATLSIRVQELCESRGGLPGLSVIMRFTVSVDVNTEPCFGTGHSLSLICQPTSEDMKLYITTFDQLIELVIGV